jgi:hypothetical protein
MRRLACVRVVTAVAMLMASIGPALADDDDVPLDPMVLVPGLWLLGAALAIGAALVVWYHLRKRALLRRPPEDGGR